jgi:hypothetical protein
MTRTDEQQINDGFAPFKVKTKAAADAAMKLKGLEIVHKSATSGLFDDMDIDETDNSLTFHFTRIDPALPMFHVHLKVVDLSDSNNALSHRARCYLDN